MSEELLNTIRVASTKLDVENDDHWTQDGLPGLEAIHQFTGNQRIKRADVTNALPDFNREAARAAAEKADEPDAPVEAGEKPFVDPNGTPINQEHSAADRKLTEEELNDRLEALAAQRIEVSANVEKAKKQITEIEREEAKIADLKAKLYPPLSFSELIEQHLAATLPREAQKVQRAEEVRKSLVDAGVLKDGEKLKTEGN